MNSDEHTRMLERRVLAGDLTYVGLLARAYERAGRPATPARTAPMTEDEIRAAMDKDGVIRGVIRVSLGTIIGLSNEGILDHFARELTGSELLADLQYRVLDVEHPSANVDDLLIEVSGDARGIVDVNHLNVDGREIVIHELLEDDQQTVTGYDIYDANDPNGDPLNLGDMFHERPTVESVRAYLRGEPQDEPDEETPCDDFCGEHAQGCDGNCDHMEHMNQCLSARRRGQIARDRAPLRARRGAEGICADCGESIVEDRGFWVHRDESLEDGGHRARPEVQSE